MPDDYRVKKILSSAELIICADGGANHARRLGITPDIILGDLDSMTSSTRRYFKRIPQLFIEDQHSTDLEKAIDYCIQRNVKTVDILGATGDRIDHTTAALGCFKKYGKQIDLKLIDSLAGISRIRLSTRLKMSIGEKVSLIPLERCEGVTTSNLQYRLHNDILELGVREGISNEAVGTNVTISLKRGTLLVYRFYKS